MSDGLDQNRDGTSGTSDADVVEERPRRRWRRFLLISLVGVPVLVGGVVFYLLQREPAHWREHKEFLSKNTPAQIQTMAQDVEKRISELAAVDISELDEAMGAIGVGDLGGGSPDGEDSTSIENDSSDKKKPVALSDLKVDVERELFLNREEVRALMSSRFEEWMIQQGYVLPDEISEPAFSIGKDGKFYLGFEFKTPVFTQVVSAQFSLKIKDGGKASLSVDQFLAGSLPVPVDSMGQYLADKVPGVAQERAEKVGQWLSKLKHLEFKPVIKVEHRRRASVLNYDVRPHGVVMTVRLQDHKTYKQGREAVASAE